MLRPTRRPTIGERPEDSRVPHNRQFRLRSRPVGRIAPTDFDFVEEPVPSPGPGQAVARVLYLSLDPTNRIWMSDIEQYMPPVAIGEVMRGGGLAQVVASNHEGYQVGDLVSGLTGWQDYVVIDPAAGSSLAVVPRGLPVPLPALLGALGATGLTAYFGLLEVGRPKPGETVVVSAAAGAVGSVVGQLAKIQGCRAVGIAGGAAKCGWITEQLGFDAAVDYKASDWREQLTRATPDGVDVSFENVGGEIMEAVIARMNLGGRVALCGMISGYNAGEPMRGPYDAILMKRLRVEGFIILDYLSRFAEGAMQLAQWMVEGKLVHRDTIVDGLEQAPTAVNLLFDGGNFGKLLVKVADPPVA
jgi:NADPH-dependent curcumin reductase CurA